MSSYNAIPRAFTSVLAPVEKLQNKSKENRDDLHEQALQQALEEARKQGFQQGLIVGREKGQALAHAEHRAQLSAEVTQFQNDLCEVLESMKTALENWCKEAEEPLAKLAVLVATKLIGHELQTNPEIPLQMVKNALSEVVNAQSVRVRMHPNDLPLVQCQSDELMHSLANLREIEFVRDPKILGGCVVETSGGSLDARIETMVEEALEALRGGA